MTQNTVTLESLRTALNAYADAPTPWQKREAMLRLVEVNAAFGKRIGAMEQWLKKEDAALRETEGNEGFAERQEKWIRDVKRYQDAHDLWQHSLSVIAGRE